MINNLIGRGNINEQMVNSTGFFTHVLLNKNKEGLFYCQLYFFSLN